MLKPPNDLTHVKTHLQTLGYDLSAGIVVFLVALPLCLGVALASGAPLFSGLVAGIVGGIVVGSLSGSRLSVSGPAAGLTAIAFAAIQQLGSFESFLLATLMAGAIQLILGILGAGWIGSLIPNAVIRGMLVAIGLILIIKQIPHAVGFGTDLMIDETYAPESPGSLLTEIERALTYISPGSTIVCGVAMAIMLVWDWLGRKRFALASFLPGPLIAVAWGLGYERLSRGSPYEIADHHLVSLPEHESIWHLFQALQHPDFSQWSNTAVIQVGLTIAIVASIETLLSLEAIERLDPEKRKAPANRELRAQGAGNMLSALLGGLPITSVIVRSSANLNAGAKSRLSSILHGVFLLVSVLFLAEWLNAVPLSTLSAVLLLTGYKLAKPSILLDMYRRGLDQFIPFTITVAAILIDDLLKGIVIGTAVGLLFVIKTNFHSAITVKQKDGNRLIRFRKDVNFLNKKRFREIIDDVEGVTHVLIDGSAARFIDRDILDSILDYNDLASASGIPVTLRNVLGFSGEINETFRDLTNSAKVN